MTNTFKVGDRVKRSDRPFARVEAHGIYTVKAVSGPDLTLVEVEGIYSAVEFTLAPPEGFKPGDKVRRIKIGWDRVVVGAIYTVQSLNGSDSLRLEEVSGTYDPAYFELVPSETFDRYDDRMLPMFTKLAEEADRQGYCAQYDRLAAIVGAPSRATIRALNRPKPLEQFQALELGDRFRAENNPAVTYIKTGIDQFTSVNGTTVWNASTDIGTGTITKL